MVPSFGGRLQSRQLPNAAFSFAAFDKCCVPTVIRRYSRAPCRCTAGPSALDPRDRSRSPLSRVLGTVKPSLGPTSQSSTGRDVSTTAAAPVTVDVVASSVSESLPSETTFTYACPICLDTTWDVSPTRLRPLRCERCGRTFRAGNKIVDLTLTSGLEPQVYRQRFWGGTEIFQSPVVSYVYERGWRAGFLWAGFPGEQREYEMAMQYLRPAYGQVLLDMSCGSGLFSRRFAKSGQFAGVIAADFSENMLRQASSFFEEDPSILPQQYSLLRADVGRLPFRTASLAAVHAGAALHCWPNPALAVAEISRVLKPGGVFVASTFLQSLAPLGQILGDDLVRPLSQITALAGQSRAYKWWEEAELRDLAAAAGLVDFEKERSFRFIMFAVRKPLLPA